MPYTIIEQNQDYGHIRLNGLFSVQDLLALQELARAGLQNAQGFRVLIELGDFAGWSQEQGWENTDFLPTSENQFSRIAFVGDARWRDDVFMFTAQPMRSKEIAFFTPDQSDKARQWLEQDIVT